MPFRRNVRRPYSRLALVTGASGGLGQAFCQRLSEQNWTILAAGRDEVALRGLEEAYPGVDAFACDLATLPDVERLAQEARQVDLLVTCAGAARKAPLIERDWKEIADEVQLNALSVARLCHLLGSAMSSRGFGRIITVASTAAARPAPTLASYAASKAFVLAMSRSLAVELGPSGVGVSCCVPGPIATSFRERAGLGKSKGASALAVVDAALRASERGSLVCYPNLGARLRWSLFANAPNAWLSSATMRTTRPTGVA